jgi:hypothetical protein
MMMEFLMSSHLEFTPGHVPDAESFGVRTVATLTFQGVEDDGLAGLSDVSLHVTLLSPEGYREPEGIIYRRGPTLRKSWESWDAGETKLLFSPLFDTVGFEVEGAARYQARRVTIRGRFPLPMYNAIGLAPGEPF